jgi:hypothetical protein
VAEAFDTAKQLRAAFIGLPGLIQAEQEYHARLEPPEHAHPVTSAFLCFSEKPQACNFQARFAI